LTGAQTKEIFDGNFKTEGLSAEASDLINKLLAANIFKRPKLNQIDSHPFFHKYSKQMANIPTKFLREPPSDEFIRELKITKRIV